VTELVIASGPLRYLGGSIETFALPMGAFIVAAWVLFAIYRRPHSVPRLKYLRPAYQVALGTREPGTEGLVYVAPAVITSPAAAPPAQAEPSADPAAAVASVDADAVAPADAEADAPAEADAQAEADTRASSDTSVSGDAPAESSDVEDEGTSAEGETS
jgi:hypothetical protein